MEMRIRSDAMEFQVISIPVSPPHPPIPFQEMLASTPRFAIASNLLSWRYEKLESSFPAVANFA